MKPLAAVELVQRDFIEIGAELREGSKLAVLGEIKLQSCILPASWPCKLLRNPTRDTDRPTLTAGRTRRS